MRCIHVQVNNTTYLLQTNKLRNPYGTTIHKTKRKTKTKTLYYNMMNTMATTSVLMEKCYNTQPLTETDTKFIKAKAKT